jgi:hypothetical protein
MTLSLFRGAVALRWLNGELSTFQVGYREFSIGS